MRRLSALALVILLTACGLDPGETADTTPPVESTTPSPSTTLPGSTTTTVATDRTPPEITVWGGLKRYSTDGIVTISGSLDEPGTVGVPGAAITQEDLYWWADLEREPGAHDITVTAEDLAGNRSEVVVSLVVDPDIEVVFAYVEAFEGFELTADYALFLSGEEANVAAREDGVIGDDETVPNDFYIRNNNPQLRKLSVAVGAPVLLQACFVEGPCVRQTGVSLEQWEGLLLGDQPAGLPEGWQWYGGGTLPYWLTVSDGVVVQITEQYLP